MLKSTTFFLAFLWSITRGMSRNLSLFSLLILKRQNKRIGIVIPTKEDYRDKNKTLYWEDFMMEKEIKIKERIVQTVSIPSMPKSQKIFLN
jgi:hypothetical protein